MNAHDIDSFIQSMNNDGLAATEQIVSDGQLHRIQIVGDKPGRKNGYYKLVDDKEPYGIYGSHKTGVRGHWSAAKSLNMERNKNGSGYEGLQLSKPIEEKKKSRRQRLAAQKCVEQFGQFDIDVDPNNPYLVKKQVGAHGIRQNGCNLKVPMHDVHENLRNTQTIFPDGTKRFSKGAQVLACFHQIGHATAQMYIAEGYATGATIYESTGLGVFVCFTANNILPVALAIKEKHLDIDVTIAADNDHMTEGNPGLTKAKQAAAKTGMMFTWPDFPQDHKGTDFNDLMLMELSHE